MKCGSNIFYVRQETQGKRKGKRQQGKEEKNTERKGRRWESKAFQFDKFLLNFTAVELGLLVYVSYSSSYGVIALCN